MSILNPSKLNQNNTTMKTILLTTAILSASLLSKADTWRKFTTSNSAIPSNIVNSVSVQGNTVWVGTEHGITGFTTQGTIKEDLGSNLPTQNTSVFAFPSNGNVWAGTDEGLVQFDGEHGWNVLTSENSGLPLNVIRSMFIDHNGKTWIGTWGGGLACMSTDWEVFTTFNSGLVSNGITALAEDKTGKIWIGTFNRGISIYDNGQWQTLNTDNSMLPSNSIQSIYADGNALWIGTSSGIAKYQDGQITKFTTANTGIVFSQVNCFIREGNYLWIGSDGGLLRYDGLGLISYNTANSGLPSNDVVSVGFDSNGNKWIGTSGGGLVEFNPNGIPAGIEEKDLSMVQVYPNPFANDLSFNNQEKEVMQVDVFNLNGQKINSFQLQAGEQTKISTLDLPAGAYNFQFHTSKKVENLRMIKTLE
jgi:ligand-binding sensor domain-containing protein